MDPEARKRFAQTNARWLAGEKIEELKFLHNSVVEAISPEGITERGWIVAATANGPEPIYTIEAEDGSGDFECPESTIKSVGKRAEL